MHAVRVLGPAIFDNPNRGTTLSAEPAGAPIELWPATSAVAPRLAHVRVTRSDSSAGWRGGLRVGIGLAIGAFALAVSFGAFAVTNGWPAWLAIVMSAVTFSGSAQFALVTAASGGSIAAGRRRRCPHQRTIHPDGRGIRPLPARRPDAAGARGAGRRRRIVGGGAERRWHARSAKLFGATLVQWPAWIAGTAIGALFAPSTDFMRQFGLDVIFPAFFLVLLLDALRGRPRLVLIALVAAVIAAASVLLLPGGVALLLCGLAALLAAARTAKRLDR